MKKLLPVLLSILLVIALYSCSDSQTSESSVEQQSQEDSSQEISTPESEESQVITDPNAKVPLPDGDYISNKNHDNAGKKMGDNDGPAYVVYSKMGYNKGEMDVAISQMKINNVRASDGKNINAYMFLGADVYSSPTGWWVNCFDTGFCYSGKNGGWHLFYNIYEVGEGTTNSWYESSVILDPSYDYKLVLDTSQEDGKAAVYIYNLSDNSLVDSKEFYVKGIKADGSNSSYLMNFALDYPQNTKLDTNGEPSNDWLEITLYNTDENVYMQNVLVTNAKLYQNGTALPWDDDVTDHYALWPDLSMTQIDYEVTIIVNNEKYTDFRVDLDMNRGGNQ